MRKIVTIFFVISWFLFFPTPAKAAVAEGQRRFVTLVYPVRGRNLWVDKELSQLDNIFDLLKRYQFTSTWLLHFDAISDRALVRKLKDGCPRCELGIFMEVSESFATEASVSYKIGDGGWARPDKAFFSGYGLIERERLVDRVFGLFKERFGYIPRSVGAWYIDPYTLSYIRRKFPEVIVHISLADQYNTDGQRYWGKYWGLPFYSQKEDIMVPANSAGNKLDLVQFQWAQRDPTESYADGVRFSQNSLQANDYRNNGKDTEYFKKLLGYYLGAEPFGQATVGLEVGQELATFFEEHVRQLAYLSKLKDEGTEVVTASGFADWYRRQYPLLSPVVKVSDGVTTWVSAPCYRLGITSHLADAESEVFDMRIYQSPSVSRDSWEPDPSYFLSREVVAAVDGLRFKGRIKYPSAESDFGLDHFSVGGRVFNFSESCGGSLGKLNYAEGNILFARFKERIIELLGVFRMSLIGGKRVAGIRTGKESLFGFWQGKGLGDFEFPFQTLEKFQVIKI